MCSTWRVAGGARFNSGLSEPNASDINSGKALTPFGRAVTPCECPHSGATVAVKPQRVLSRVIGWTQVTSAVDNGSSCSLLPRAGAQRPWSLPCLGITLEGVVGRYSSSLAWPRSQWWTTAEGCGQFAGCQVRLRQVHKADERAGKRGLRGKDMGAEVLVPKGEEESCGMGNDHLRLTLWAQILGWGPHTLLAHTDPSDRPVLGFLFFCCTLFLILHGDPWSLLRMRRSTIKGDMAWPPSHHGLGTVMPGCLFQSLCP